MIPNDPQVEKLLARLADAPARDPRAVKKGRAQFLAQARRLAPAVSNPEDVRHTGWNKNIFERIWKMMKPRSIAVAFGRRRGIGAGRRAGVEQRHHRLCSTGAAARHRGGAKRGQNRAGHPALPHRELYQPAGQRRRAATRTITESYIDLATGAMRDVTQRCRRQDPGSERLRRQR